MHTPSSQMFVKLLPIFYNLRSPGSLESLALSTILHSVASHKATGVINNAFTNVEPQYSYSKFAFLPCTTVAEIFKTLLSQWPVYGKI